MHQKISRELLRIDQCNCISTYHPYPDLDASSAEEHRTGKVRLNVACASHVHSVYSSTAFMLAELGSIYLHDCVWLSLASVHLNASRDKY